MSNRNEVAVLYRLVIEDVVRNIRREFVNMGVDEQVLHELQTGWERRLLESGIFSVNTPSNTTASAAVGRMVPGSAAAAMYYYSQQQQQQVMPVIGLDALVSAATTASSSSTSNIINNNENNATKIKQPQPKRHEDSDPDALNSDLDSSSDEDICRSASVPTLNNNNNSGDAQQKHEEVADEQVKENILLCLYEKVHRTRNKWRCIFKEGILHLDGQEYCLNKINGEFEW